MYDNIEIIIIKYKFGLHYNKNEVGPNSIMTVNISFPRKKALNTLCMHNILYS